MSRRTDPPTWPAPVAALLIVAVVVGLVMLLRWPASETKPVPLPTELAEMGARLQHVAMLEVRTWPTEGKGWIVHVTGLPPGASRALGGGARPVER